MDLNNFLMSSRQKNKVIQYFCSGKKGPKLILHGFQYKETKLRELPQVKISIANIFTIDFLCRTNVC